MFLGYRKAAQIHKSETPSATESSCSPRGMVIRVTGLSTSLPS